MRLSSAGSAARLSSAGSASVDGTPRKAFVGAARHWLLALNLGCGVFIGGALAAPVLAASGLTRVADVLYAAYHLTCHQWPFRTFFLFGPQPIYDQADLLNQGLDPYRFVGDQARGWKMAFCERDLAIYFGLLAVGLFYSRHRTLRPAGFSLYGILILPMAVDGFTQLFGWRESTWELRVLSGLLFGLASGWLVLPRLDPAIGQPVTHTPYAPENVACDPPPVVTSVPPLSHGG